MWLMSEVVMDPRRETEPQPGYIHNTNRVLYMQDIVLGSNFKEQRDES